MAEEEKTLDQITEQAADEVKEAPEENKSLEETLTRREYVHHVITTREANRERVEKREMFWSKWAALQEAKRTKSVLIATVIGIEPHDQIKTAFLVCLYDRQFKILIPWNEVFAQDPIKRSADETDDSVYARQQQMLKKMIQAEVSVVIMQTEAGRDRDGRDVAILGSRKEALKKLTRQNFRKDANGRQQTKVGDFVKAYVTSVSYNSLNACICGVDTTLEKHDLTFRPIVNLMDNYAPGDVINVQIQKITLDKGQYKLDASAKANELEEAQMNNTLSKGTLTFGTVTSIKNQEGGRMTIYVWVPFYEVPARATFTPNAYMRQAIKQGVEVDIRVRDQAKNGLFLCDCLGARGSGGVFSASRRFS